MTIYIYMQSIIVETPRMLFASHSQPLFFPIQVVGVDFSSSFVEAAEKMREEGRCGLMAFTCPHMLLNGCELSLGSLRWVAVLKTTSESKLLIVSSFSTTAVAVY